MKQTNILCKIFLCIIFCTHSSFDYAQGVKVYTKTGETFKIPYEQLDRITTYESQDAEGEISGGSNVPFDENRSRTFTVNGVSFCMIPVKAGIFQMGSSSSTYRGTDEYPVHSVTLTQNYYIGESEVTQALWKAVMGTETMNADEYPVSKISYKDVTVFISKLNSLTGEQFRMPTEAEWEYAARGGNKSKKYTYSGRNALNPIAWYEGNSSYYSHKVKTKEPNELGIYDMSGNVFEWCSDWYSSSYYSNSPSKDPTGPVSGQYRVIRGGSYFSEDECRNSARSYDAPDRQSSYIGARLALTASN